MPINSSVKPSDPFGARGWGRRIAAPMGTFQGTVLRVLARRNKAFTPVATGIAFALFGIIWIAISTPQYEAKIVIAPNSQKHVPSGIGGLLASVGADLGDLRENANLDQFKYLLTAPRTAAALDEKYQIMPHFYKKEWNARTRSWQEPSSLGHLIKKVGFAPLGLKAWAPPDAQGLSEVIAKHLRIDTVESSSLITVSYTASTRKFATFMLAALVHQADDIIRADHVKKLDSQIAYAEGQLKNVTLQDTRTALLDVLASQYRDRVLAGGSGLYIGQIIEDVRAPQLPSWPRPALMMGLCFLGWGLTMLLLYGGRTMLRLAASL